MGLKAVANLFTISPLPPTFNQVDAEVPAGTKNGINTAFTLTQAPNPAASLELFYNGSKLTSGVGYTLAGANITAISPYLPNTANNDNYEAYYRY